MRCAVFLLGWMLLSPLGDLSAAEFRSDFAKQVDRRWAGPEWLANRLQDWRVEDRWLECVEARPAFPVRTCGLLTREIDPRRGGFVMRTEIRGVSAGPRDGKDWAGFLFGVGGPEIDYRIRALVQGKPAEDGGILAVVDGTGRVAFRDFSRRVGSTGYWSIDGALPEGACRILAGEKRSGKALGVKDRIEPLILELTVEVGAEGTATATLRSLRGDQEVARAELEGLALDRVDGSVSLVSHGGVDQLGHAFRRVRLSGAAVQEVPDRAFGPVLGVLYTVSDTAHGGTLNLTAQLPPLGEKDPFVAELQLLGSEGEWKSVALAERAPLADTCTFRVTPMPAIADLPFRVQVGLARRGGPETVIFTYDGIIRAEPRENDPVSIGLLSCVKNYTGDLRWNENSIWFPHASIVDALLGQSPDLLLCAGDQIYEGDLSGAVRKPEEAMILDYHTKWHRWLWAFGDLTRITPTVTIPDDHDVYHGNIWGAGNIPAPEGAGLSRQDRGGYRLPPDLVNAIHTTQTSHLPAPVDPDPIEGGISVYFTRLEYAGISLAILADRMWKSAPSALLPEGGIVNGWSKNPEFDWVKDGDPEGGELLGPRQEAFLADWAVDYAGGAWLKVALSGSPFVNLATLPLPANSDAAVPGLAIPEFDEYPEGEVAVADADSNGWPRSARDRAVALLRLGSALHLTGDQHLASALQYGIDEPGDAGLVFSGPAVANTWPRRWFPAVPGKKRARGAPVYTGNFLDGFGNPMRVLAVANPVKRGLAPERLHDRVPGFGLVRLERETQTITLECWPRGVDPNHPEALQYPGWPISVPAAILDNRAAWGLLPPVRAPEDLPPPVVRVKVEPRGVILSARRLRQGEEWRPPVYAPGKYTIEVGDGDGAWQVRKEQRPVPLPRD